jgi:hypothetical protein
MPKRKRTSPTIPRPLTERERTIIALYCTCKFGMTPQQFYTKWAVTKVEVASICFRSLSTVDRWFTQGRSYRPPTINDLRHLALMDFLLEHIEEIPQALLDVLCPPK